LAQRLAYCNLKQAYPRIWDERQAIPFGQDVPTRPAPLAGRQTALGTVV